MDYCEITKLKNNTYMYWDNGDITEISNIKDTYQPLEEVKEYKKKTINLRRN